MNILALVSFLVKGALSTFVLRGVRDRGFGVSLAYYERGAGGYTPDPCEDFATAGALIDMSRKSGYAALDFLEQIVEERGIGLVLQIGATRAYPQLPYLKERNPRVPVLDILYNKVGHTVNHFLYEACFDGVIVESLDMARYVLGCTSKSAPVTRVVESGIDTDRFRPAMRAARGGFTVGFIGRMSPEKNPIGFVALAERLHAAMPALTFRMFGKGPLLSEVRERIFASGAAGAIEIQGYIDDQRTALGNVDVLVVPSILDGRPVVIMEANACGIPVIGAPVGAIPELIEDGHNGFVLRPEAYNEIAHVLQGWMKEPSTYNAIRESSRAIAEAKFGYRAMLHAYETVFREFLAERS